MNKNDNISSEVKIGCKKLIDFIKLTKSRNLDIILQSPFCDIHVFPLDPTVSLKFVKTMKMVSPRIFYNSTVIEIFNIYSEGEFIIEPYSGDNYEFFYEKLYLILMYLKNIKFNFNKEEIFNYIIEILKSNSCSYFDEIVNYLSTTHPVLIKDFFDKNSIYSVIENSRQLIKNNSFDTYKNQFNQESVLKNKKMYLNDEELDKKDLEFQLNKEFNFNTKEYIRSNILFANSKFLKRQIKAIANKKQKEIDYYHNQNILNNKYNKNKRDNTLFSKLTNTIKQHSSFE